MTSINKKALECCGDVITAAFARQFFSDNPSFLGHRKEADITSATGKILSLVVISGKKLDLGGYYALLAQGIQMDEAWDDLFISQHIRRNKKYHNSQKKHPLAA